jgi:anaerobic selenocysteine-containing dehydrogenase
MTYREQEGKVVYQVKDGKSYRTFFALEWLTLTDRKRNHCFIYCNRKGAIMTETKHVACKTCDGGCMLLAKTEDGKIISLEGVPPDHAICNKARYAMDYVNHPNRLTYPLKNVGKRGEQKWERLRWEEALDEIAERLETILDKYGPESFALSTLQVNGGISSGAPRRFMNLLGSPNWLSGLSMCIGNTAQVHRLTYGWYSSSIYDVAQCIVYHGKNPHGENWVGEYIKLNKALERGAKLIVMDPRRSEVADRAHLFLPLRYGTDAAMLLGWLNVIINEGLYDKDFVDTWTVGFEELKERVQEYPLNRVAQITEFEQTPVHMPTILFDPFTSGTGLATPSGKVEINSSVLKALGYDPLPYYKEPEQSPVSNPDLAKEYPLTLFVGLREGPFYHSNLRHITGLRKRLPNPLALLNPDDGDKFGIASGNWIWVETTHGRIRMMAQLDNIQPAGTVRVPHGWWMSEMEPGMETGFSGAMIYNDAMLLSDDPWNLDVEQGLPNLRGGILAKIYTVENE